MKIPIHARAVRLTSALMAGACALMQPMLAFAGDPFPIRPLTLMVPFPPGGTTDVLGRALGQAMGRQLGQTVIVDNKAGAGGTLGATWVMRAQPDGYTILFGTPADQANAPFLMAKPPYNPAKDFEPIGCMLRAPNVLVVNPKLGIGTVADLVKLAQAHPEKLNCGSAGNGNSSHLTGELFSMTANAPLTHVPYRGNAPAITDTIGGQVQMLFSGTASVLPHIRSGALKPLAVTSTKRIKDLPDVPTLREAGVPLDVYTWGCLLAPARTPADVLDRLHAAMQRALEDPAVVQAIETSGGERFPGSRADARKFMDAERAMWGNVIRTRKIQAD